MTEESHPELGSGALREALAKVKALVSGDRLPFWKEDGLTVTATRYTIADICDAALSLSSPTESRCTCFERADGIGPMHGIHDSKCPAGGSKKS